MKNAGFDISLGDAISELSLTIDEVRELDRLTKTRAVAHSRFGFQVMYRKETLKRLFKR